MEKNGCLTKKQLLELRSLLEKAKQDVLSDIRKGLEEDVKSKKEIGDVGDMSVDDMIKTFSMKVRDREVKYLKKIEKALKKIDDGTYGICEKCGKCISFERLKLRPVAELCIKCKLEQEKMERKLGEE